MGTQTKKKKKKETKAKQKLKCQLNLVLVLHGVRKVNQSLLPVSTCLKREQNGEPVQSRSRSKTIKWYLQDDPRLALRQRSISRQFSFPKIA